MSSSWLFVASLLLGATLARSLSTNSINDLPDAMFTGLPEFLMVGKGNKAHGGGFAAAMDGLKEVFSEQFLGGFLPALGRARRSAGPQEKPYLDTIVVGMGAFMDEQEVRNG